MWRPNTTRPDHWKRQEERNTRLKIRQKQVELSFELGNETKQLGYIYLTNGGRGTQHAIKKIKPLDPAIEGSRLAATPGFCDE